MKNISVLIVILAVGVVAYMYYRKKTSSGVSAPPVKMPDAVLERSVAVDMNTRGATN